MIMYIYTYIYIYYTIYIYNRIYIYVYNNNNINNNNNNTHTYIYIHMIIYRIIYIWRFPKKWVPQTIQDIQDMNDHDSLYWNSHGDFWGSSMT